MAELKDHRDRIEVYKRDDGKWAWRLILNHNIVATDHSQGYENLSDAQTMAERIVRGEFKDVPIRRIGD